MKALALVVLGVAVSGAARADRWSRSPQGAAWLHYELAAYDDVDDTRGGGVPRQLVLAGARLHGFVGPSAPVGFHAGIDLAAGSTIGRAGFAYDVALFPLGVGMRLGRTGVLAFGVGVGAMGAIGTLDDAVTMPFEATLELGGGRVRVLGRARASYVAGADGRHDGAPSVAFADELDTMLGVRVGRHYEKYAPAGEGYFVGGAYRELAGSRFVGVVVGHSIDMATGR